MPQLLVLTIGFFFENGYTYYGTINVSRSNLTFTSYGASPNKAIISGLTTINRASWVSMGSGKWKTSVPSSIDKLNVVTYWQSGESWRKPVEVGRFPDPQDANSGYLTFETFVENNSITDSQSPFTNAWNGAEVCIRKRDYTLERHFSANINSNTIGYTRALNINFYNPMYFGEKSNYGYFLQNHTLALNRFSEWTYTLNGSNGDLTMFFGVENPVNYKERFSISTLDVLLNIGTNNNIIVTNLKFEGANKSAIYLLDKSGANYIRHSNITISDCEFINIGARAIQLINVDNILIENCNFNWCLSNGIQASYAAPQYGNSNCTIRSCVFDNIAPYVGMGSYMDNADFCAIEATANSELIIEKNEIKNVAKAGILWQGNDVIIRKNVIKDAVKSFTDYGAIYTFIDNSTNTGMMKVYASPTAPLVVYGNREISNNIISDCYGQPAGTPNSIGQPNTELNANGIYLDGETMGVNVSNNTVFNISRNAISANNPVGINLSDNILYNFRRNAIHFSKLYANNAVPQLSINITGNLCFSTESENHNISYLNDALNLLGGNITTALSTVGTINNNFYGFINPTPFVFDLYNYNASTQLRTILPSPEMNFDVWKTLSGKDATSQLININHYFPQTIGGDIGNNKFPNGEFINSTSINPIIVQSTSGTINGVTVTSTISKNWANIAMSGSGALGINIVNTPSAIANRYPFLFSGIGQIESSKSYSLRFITRGTSPNGILKAYLKLTNSPFTQVTPKYKKSFGTEDLLHEFIFTNPSLPSSPLNASFVIELENNTGSTYIDKIEFFETNSVQYDYNNNVLFYYNSTDNVQNITVDEFNNPIGCYHTYSSSYPINPQIDFTPPSITLQPYTSTLLFNGLFCGDIEKSFKKISDGEEYKEKIKFYPNPATNTITISGLDLGQKWDNLEIIAVTGESISTMNRIFKQNKIVLDISKLSNGLYFVKLKDKNMHYYTIKFIKN